MPKVSICVPAYKNPEGIARLLASVAGQTFADYEVIVTDDSPDESVEAVVRKADIANLFYHKNEKRLGATANWNEAVRRARGVYIKMMHHDDWFCDADSLGRFVALLDGAPGAVLAFSGSMQITLSQGRETGGFARGISGGQEALLRSDWRNLFLGNVIGAPSATIYRKNPNVYEEALTWLMDMEYYMRLLREKPAFACTAEPLVCIGVSESQLTESCRADGELNLFEYGWLFREFGLLGEKKYRDKMVEVALKFKIPYRGLKPYGIPRKEYQKASRKKQREDFWFLLGVARRKILERCGMAGKKRTDGNKNDE